MTVSSEFAGDRDARDRTQGPDPAAVLDTRDDADAGGPRPSVTDVAEAAEVSRATAYRYFPTQAALVQAAVDEALGPIALAPPTRRMPSRASRSCSPSPTPASTSTSRWRGRALPAVDGAMEPAAAGTLGTRRRSSPATGASSSAARWRRYRNEMPRARLRQAAAGPVADLGAEAFVDLKDIWGLDGAHARAVALWAAHALVRAAMVGCGRETARGRGWRAGRLAVTKRSPKSNQAAIAPQDDCQT